jgi:L-rhamnose isomerase
MFYGTDEKQADSRVDTYGYCTDGSKAQRKYAKSHGLECVQIKGGKSKKGISK